MNYTRNLKLQMPLQTEKYNIEHQNKNMRIIDETMGKIPFVNDEQASLICAERFENSAIDTSGTIVENTTAVCYRYDLLEATKIIDVYVSGACSQALPLYVIKDVDGNVVEMGWSSSEESLTIGQEYHVILPDNAAFLYVNQLKTNEFFYEAVVSYTKKFEVDFESLSDDVLFDIKASIKIRGKINVNSVIESDDTNFNGREIDTIPVEFGDAFIATATTAWWGGMVSVVKGDLIVSVGTTASLAANWMVLSGRDAVKAIEEVLPDKEDNSNKGVADGYTPLNEKAVVPDEHLPITREHTLLSNSLKGTASGAIVALDDVSPVGHEVNCTVKSKNLLKYPYYQTTKTQNGITFTDNGDGSITVNGTATANTTFIFGSSTVAKSPRKLPKGVWVTASSNSPNVQFAIQAIKDDGSLKGVAYLYNDSKKFFTDYENYYVYLYVLEGKEVNSETVYPQLEEGTESTEWVPYVAPESVTLSKYGKNLSSVATKTVQGKGSWQNSNVRNIYLPKGKYIASLKYAQVGVIVDKVAMVVRTYDDNSNLGGGNATSSTEKGVLVYPFEVVDAYKEIKIQIWSNYTGVATEENTILNVTNLQLEVDNGTGLPTEFEEPVVTAYIPNADGTVDGVTSLAPNMTLMTDTENTYADVTYNRDINKAFEEMYNAIISLGGSI